jgi:hypothetical protein
MLAPSTRHAVQEHALDAMQSDGNALKLAIAAAGFVDASAQHWQSLPWRVARVWGTEKIKVKDEPKAAAEADAAAKADPEEAARLAKLLLEFVGKQPAAAKGSADAKGEPKAEADAGAEAKADAEAVAKLGELLLDFWAMQQMDPKPEGNALWRCVNIREVDAKIAPLRIGLEYDPGARGAGRPARPRGRAGEGFQLGPATHCCLANLFLPTSQCLCRSFPNPFHSVIQARHVAPRTRRLPS